MILYVKEGVVEKKLKAPGNYSGIHDITSLSNPNFDLKTFNLTYLLPLGLLLLNIKYPDLLNCPCICLHFAVVILTPLKAFSTMDLDRDSSSRCKDVNGLLSV
jgi:hypothetical protein